MHAADAIDQRFGCGLLQDNTTTAQLEGLYEFLLITSRIHGRRILQSIADTGVTFRPESGPVSPRNPVGLGRQGRVLDLDVVCRPKASAAMDRGNCSTVRVALDSGRSFPQPDFWPESAGTSASRACSVNLTCDSRTPSQSDT